MRSEKESRQLAKQLYELRIEYAKAKAYMNCTDDVTLIKVVHLNECILRKADELARAVLDEVEGWRG